MKTGVAILVVLLLSGCNRYTAVTAKAGEMWRLDTWTGETRYCFAPSIGTAGACLFVEQRTFSVKL